MNLMVSNFKMNFYNRWKLIHAFVNIVGVLLTLWMGRPLIWLIAVAISFLFLINHIYKSLNFNPFKIGYANSITALRFLIVILLSFLAGKVHNIFLLSGFLFAVLLDGVDGFLARRFKQCSDIGEAFDMEVDSFMVFILCWIHFSNHTVGWWILIAGGYKYYNELLFFNLNKVNSKDSPKKFRSTIAVIFFFSLLLAFVLPASLNIYILAFSSMLIILSFSISIIYKLRKVGECE